jgi:hypothetical protein
MNKIYLSGVASIPGITALAVKNSLGNDEINKLPALLIKFKFESLWAWEEGELELFDCFAVSELPKFRSFATSGFHKSVLKYTYSCIKLNIIRLTF